MRSLDYAPALPITYATRLVREHARTPPTSALLLTMADHVHQYHAARNIFIERNMRLVHSIARKFHFARTGRQGHFNDSDDQYHDLVMEGMLGVMRAAELYDGRNRFSTYATWWIRQHILRYTTSQTNLMHVPAHIAQVFAKINSLHAQLELSGHPVSIEDLCRESGIDPLEYARIYQSSRRGISLDGENDRDDNLYDTMPATSIQPDEELIAKETRTQAQEELDTLLPVERRVLTMRYGLDDEGTLSLEQTAQKLKKTRAEVRAIEVRAMRKLRARKEQLLAREQELDR